MRRRTVLIVVVSVLAAVAAGSSAARTDRCTAGVKTVGGLQERVFCGPAKASVRYGSKVFRFAQGECEKGSKYVAVNIGTVVLGPTSRPKPNYFGLVVGESPAGGTKAAARDGAYTGGVLALDYGGKGYLVRGETLQISLAGGRSRGTFSGSSLFENPPVKITGTFSC